MEEKRVEDTIIETSLKMFISKGIKDVSMDDIAQSLGMSKRTLYTYFNSKAALLVRCVEHMHTSKHKSFERIMETGMNFIEVMLNCFYEATTYLKQTNPAFLTDLGKNDYSAALNALTYRIETTRQQLIGLIKKGQADGIISPMVDAEMLSYMVSGENHIAHTAGLCNQSRWSVTDILKQITIVFLRGIATVKGQQMIDNFLVEKGFVSKEE